MQQDLTIDELSVIVRKHPETLRKLARKMQLPGAYRLGKTWRIPAEAVDRMRGVEGSR